MVMLNYGECWGGALGKHIVEGKYGGSNDQTCLVQLPVVTTLIYIQWEFQDPKMEVLYHIRPYIYIFLGGDIPLHRPYIGLIYGSWNGHWYIGTLHFAHNLWQFNMDIAT